MKYFFKESGRRSHYGSTVLLSNFRSNFEASAKAVVTLQRSGVASDLDKISIIGGKMNRRIPNLEKMTDIYYAKQLAAKRAHIAARRLRFLLAQCDDQDEGLVSHEHIAVYSGYNGIGTFLQDIAQSDISMVTKNKEKVSSILKSSLKNSVPPSDGKGHLGRAGLLTKDHEEEISSFVNMYLRLLHLSYSEIPMLAGKPPSAYVPSTSVSGESMKGTIYHSDSHMVHIARKILEKVEGDKIVLSRDLAAPSKAYTVLFTVVLWALTCWLWIVAMKKVLVPSICKREAMSILVTVAQLSVYYTLQTLANMLKGPLRMSTNSLSWEVATSFTEVIVRRVSMKLGKPTPFDQEMKRLKMSCQDQYRIWKIRIANKTFYDSLKRKLITSRACFLLLTDLARCHVQGKDEEVVEGIIPGTIEEAEAFLNLDIDDEADPTSKEAKFSIEAFHDMESNVESCLDFAAHDRIFVNEDTNEDWKSVRQPNMDNSTVSCRRNRTGTVVSCSPTVCFVNFDGEILRSPTPIPIELCSHIEESSLHNIDQALMDGGTKQASSSTFHDRPDNLGSDEDSDGETSNASSSNSNVTDKDPAVVHTKEKEKRAQTVKEALLQGAWKLVRTKKHIKYSRRVRVSLW